MIPIRDHHETSTTPFITYLLLGINVLVFVFMFTLPAGRLEQFVLRFAFIPREIVAGIDYFTLLTSMFLHGGLGHIIGNMLFLNIFGDNLEEWFGHLSFLGFYLLSGIGASLLQILVDPTSSIPNLGASGAIAGLMGGYLLLFPNHRIDILIPLGALAQRATVPAYTMLLYWFVIQFFSGIGGLSIPQQGGVAYFAHIGGFVTGFGLTLLYRLIRPAELHH